jgi:hypothetical protein
MLSEVLLLCGKMLVHFYLATLGVVMIGIATLAVSFSEFYMGPEADLCYNAHLLQASLPLASACQHRVVRRPEASLGLFYILSRLNFASIVSNAIYRPIYPKCAVICRRRDDWRRY